MRASRKGVENARKELPAMLAEAEKGRSTVITRHGRSIAAIVPVDRALPARRQKSLLGLAGFRQRSLGQGESKGSA